MPEERKTTKAQQRAVHKYVKNHYDRIEVRLWKGYREKIQDHASAAGESVNAYIKKAVDDRMASEDNKAEQ